MNSRHSTQQPPFSGWWSLICGFKVFRDSTSMVHTGQAMGVVRSTLASCAFICCGKVVSCLKVVIHTVHSTEAVGFFLLIKDIKSKIIQPCMSAILRSKVAILSSVLMLQNTMVTIHHWVGTQIPSDGIRRVIQVSNQQHEFSYWIGIGSELQTW